MPGALSKILSSFAPKNDGVSTVEGQSSAQPSAEMIQAEPKVSEKNDAGLRGWRERFEIDSHRPEIVSGNVPIAKEESVHPPVGAKLWASRPHSVDRLNANASLPSDATTWTWEGSDRWYDRKQWPW